MNLSRLITIIALAALPVAAAPDSNPQAGGNPASENTDNTVSGKSNEVTVVLPPPEEVPSAPADVESDAEQAEAVTGGHQKPETVPADSADGREADQTAADPSPEEAPQVPEPGLAVRVERLQAGSGEVDPAQIKLLAPFPAKLLARTPEGWRIEASEQAPPFTREVELAPGKNITLSIRPHLLVAEADGATVFQVPEPGFEAALGYRQNATVGAILASSIRQLEHDSQQLGTAIEQLQQLLVSLPKSPAEQQPPPKPE